MSLTIKEIRKKKAQYYFTVARMAIAKDMRFHVLARVWNKEKYIYKCIIDENVN